MYHAGPGTIIVKPVNTTQVSNILQFCNEYGLSVVPQGNNDKDVIVDITSMMYHTI